MVSALGRLRKTTAVVIVRWVLRVRNAAKRCRVKTPAAKMELRSEAWPTRLVRASVRTARLSPNAKALRRVKISARTAASKQGLTVRATAVALAPSVSRA